MNSPGVLQLFAVPVWWALYVAGTWLTFKWRRDPARIMRMAEVVGPAMFMSPVRYARMLPSVLLLGFGFSVATFPIWWLSVEEARSGLSQDDADFSLPFQVSVIVFLVGTFISVVFMVSTAVFRRPRLLVFEFLRDDHGEPAYSALDEPK